MNDNRPLEIIADYLRDLRDERGDDQFAHISDCYGCDNATYLRRQPGFEPLVPSDQSVTKMRNGTRCEADTFDALEAAYRAEGYAIFRNYRIAWRPEGGAGAYRELCEPFHAPIGEAACQGCNMCEPYGDELVGHIDFYFCRIGKTTGILDRLDVCIFEGKSTVFYGKPPKDPSPYFCEQTYSYATAVKAERAGLIVECRATGERKLWWFTRGEYAEPGYDLDALEYVAVARAKAVLEHTDPNALTPPEARPRYDFQCDYCDAGACPKNKRARKARKAVAV
jgi:hypothetical protein